VKLYFGKNERLSINKPLDEKAAFDYTSDPAKPVPYTSQIEGLVFTPRSFMSDDQRNAGRRPDVLSFETETANRRCTCCWRDHGEAESSDDRTDADFIVKLIDVYPQDHEKYEHNPKNIVMGGYEQLVRSEVNAWKIPQ